MDVLALLEMNRYFQKSSVHVSLPGFIVLCLLHDNGQLDRVQLEQFFPGYDLNRHLNLLLSPVKVNAVGFVDEVIGKKYRLSTYGKAYMDKVMAKN